MVDTDTVFKKNFPSLKGHETNGFQKYRVKVRKPADIQAIPNGKFPDIIQEDILEFYTYPSFVILNYCLDKQRVKEAIEKFEKFTPQVHPDFEKDSHTNRVLYALMRELGLE